MFKRQPTFRLVVGYPEAKAITEAFEANDLIGVRAIFDRADWSMRSVLVRAIADHPGSELPLRARLEEVPTDTVTATMLAVRLINMGWAVRSNSRAKYVSRKQFAGFHDYLRQAEQLLVDVVARDPESGVALEARLTTARGLGLGQAEARRRFDQAMGVMPGHYLAQSKYLQQLCPKWGGDQATLYAFARRCAESSEPGSLSGALVPEAHLEQVLDLSGIRFAAYMRRPDVSDEIRMAALRSVRHPDFRRIGGWIHAMNAFAMASSLTKDYETAAFCFAQLDNLDNLGTELPWAYFGIDGVPYYRKYRRLALRKVGRP